MQSKLFRDLFTERQLSIKNWLLYKIKEPNQFESIENRSQRFFEEATELVQATGLTRNQCHDLVDYVFNRPKGDLPQEIGGVMTCLAVLAERLNQNVGECLDREIDRVHKPEMIEKVRAAIERKRNDGVGI